MNLERFDEAHNDALRVIQLRPDYAVTYSYLGDLYEIKNEKQKALNSYSESLQRDSTQSKVYIKRAYLHEDLCDSSKALSDFKTALKFDGNNSNLHFRIGLYQMKVGNYHDAKTSFLKALVITPDLFTARFNIAICKYNLNDNIGAYKDVSTYLNYVQNDVEAYLFKADLELSHFGNTERCMSDLNKAISNGGNVKAYITRAHLYMDDEKYDEAKDDLNKAMNLDPSNKLIYATKSRLLIETGNLNESIAEFSKAIKMLNDVNLIKDGYFIRSSMLYSYGYTEEAIADLDSVLMIAANNTEALEIKTRYLYELEKFDQVIQIVTKRIEIDKENDQLYAYRARVYSRMRLYYESELDYDSAIEINSSNSEYFYSRGLVKLRQKKRSLACKDFRIAASMGNESARHAVNDECR